MGRIRTVKPELGRHRGLFEAEKETGLPLRFTWIMLFTACDREGRFKWRPWDLKLDIIPYDDIDFARVLDALLTRGFLVKYRCGREWYGHIPTFRKHQAINNREKPSDLPDPIKADESVSYTDQELPNACASREARDSGASTTPLDSTQGEGKGREGKGAVADATPKVLTFWDVGESFGISRSTIGRMIRDHGEVAVSDALRNLSLRTKRPADPTQYVMGMLKSQREENPMRGVL